MYVVPLKPAPVTLAFLLIACSASLFYLNYRTSLPGRTQISSPTLCGNDGKNLKHWDSANFVVGPPKDLFKDNLRNDTFYITSWSNGGFTNQFMSYVNMIYLGTISGRVPIVPPFAPDHHIQISSGPLPFTEVFDLTILRDTLRKPILEWSEIKTLAPHFSLDPPACIEQIGCWSTRSQDEKHAIGAIQLLHHLGLDISYTRVPAHTRHDPSLPADVFVAFFPLAEAIFPEHPSDTSGDQDLMFPSPLGAKLGPDLHMACFDLMYFATAGTRQYEWTAPWSPVWRTVGRHLRFAKGLEKLAQGYARKALQVASGELPPFITVHARRGDFVHQCRDVPTECLAPLSAFVQKVKEVQDSLLDKHGIKVSEVLITSDETDPEFWKQVAAEGWRYIDHTAERTVERYGEWYMTLIDVVVQSMGSGFVGSIDSTVSLTSARRVEDWNQGVTRMVGWGGRE